MTERIRSKVLVAAIVGCVLTLSGTLGSCQRGTADIKVGAILGLTGDYAAYGEKMRRGYEFALDQVDSAGGVSGRKVVLLAEDSQFDPAKAVTAYQKLYAAQGVRIYVGITGSKNALPVCEASKDDDVVIVDPLGSAPKLTQYGGPNYFRIMASDALAGKYNVDWAMESGMKRPAIVFMEDDWGSSYRDSVVDYLEKKGFADTPSLGVLPGTRDFRTEIEKLKASSPDAVFLLLYAKEGSSFMQQLRQAGVDAQVYGSDNISATEFVSAGNEVVEGVRVALPAAAHGPTYDKFVQDYRSKYSEEPDANVIKSYDAMELVVAAIAEVGTEPSKIKEYFRSPGFEYKGVSGVIKFDANGDLVSQEYTRMVYRSGTLEPVEG